MKKLYRNFYRKAADFWNDEEGMGTVEIILIIVVLIGLVLIFKDQMTSLVKTIFADITNDTNEVLK